MHCNASLIDLADGYGFGQTGYSRLVTDRQTGAQTHDYINTPS